MKPQERVQRVRDYFRTTSAEEHLMNLAARGISLPCHRTEQEMEQVARCLRERRMQVFFRTFWTHEDVVLFHHRFSHLLSALDVVWYLSVLRGLLSSRESHHWIERVNLFHVFGLSRLVQGTDAVDVIEREYGYGAHGGGRPIQTLTDISANNVIAMTRYEDVRDCVEILERLAGGHRIMTAFAKYQIYYYGGLDGMFRTLREYLDSPKKVVVPQTVLSLRHFAETDPGLTGSEIRMRIDTDLLARLPAVVAGRIERLTGG